VRHETHHRPVRHGEGVKSATATAPWAFGRNSRSTLLVATNRSEVSDMAFAPSIGPGGWALLPAHFDEDGRRGFARDRRELLARYPNRLSRVPRNLRMAIEVAREQEGEDVRTARGPRSPGCARSRASGRRLATCLRPSTAGSPRASTSPISRKQTRCWASCSDA
jgi:hypothetical protein